MTYAATVTRAASICDLRRHIEEKPQLKFRLAAALSDVLSKEDIHLSSSVLGSLSFCSYDELERMGVKPPHCEWTI